MGVAIIIPGVVFTENLGKVTLVDVNSTNPLTTAVVLADLKGNVTEKKYPF